MIAVVLFMALMFFMFSILLLSKRNKRILFSVDNIVILAFIVIFTFLFPIDYLYSVTEDVYRDYLVILSSYSVFDVVVYYCISFLFLVCFVKTFRTRFGLKGILSNDEDLNQIIPKRFVIATYIMLFIGILADFLYLRAYGGYSNYLNYAAYIRSGASSFNNPFSFLITFRHCIVLASYFLFAMSFEKRKHIPFFVLSFVYSLFIFYSDKGRLSFALYLLIFPLFIILRKYKTEYIKTNFIFTIGIIGLIFARLITYIGELLSRSTNTDVVETLISESSFIFANMKVMLSADYSFRFFIDFIAYPLFILPSSLWRKILPNTASDIMTILVSGSKKGTNGVYGECPIDILSISYMQLGIVGVLVGSILLGLFVAWIFKKANKIKNKSVSLMVKEYLVVSLVLRSIFYGDSYNIIQRIFPLVVFALLYFTLGFFKDRRVT